MVNFKVDKNYKSYIGNLYAVYTRCWTDSAIMCFERGCNCDGCIFKNLFEADRCHMKVQVLELVRTIGLPKDVVTKKII